MYTISTTSDLIVLIFTTLKLHQLIRSSFSILCFHSKNENNSHSEVVASKLEVIVKADVILQG